MTYSGHGTSQKIYRVSYYDFIICTGPLCEQVVCLKKHGCVDNAADSYERTSCFYLLTLGLMTFTYCWTSTLIWSHTDSTMGHPIKKKKKAKNFCFVNYKLFLYKIIGLEQRATVFWYHSHVYFCMSLTCKLWYW